MELIVYHSLPYFGKGVFSLEFTHFLASALVDMIPARLPATAVDNFAAFHENFPCPPGIVPSEKTRKNKWKSYQHRRIPPSRARAWYVIRNIRIRVLLILVLSQTTHVRARMREDFFTTEWLPLRKNIRKLTPRLKKFALALKRVLMDVPGPENLHREKIMKALKIKRRHQNHQRLLQ